MVWVELGLLFEITNIQTRHRYGVTFDFFVDAGHNPQQSRFTRPVCTQHANLGTRKKRQRNIAQNLTLGGHGLADAVHGVYVLGHLVCRSIENNR